MRVIQRYWPLAVIIFIYLLVILVLAGISMKQNDGHLVYAFDDPYIHMSIAKNIVLHRVFGVTRYEFSSSTSSLLWTMLLALNFAIFGVQDWIPLILNILAGMSLLVGGYFILLRYITQRWIVMSIVLIAMFVMPLPTMVFAGMEHTLHAFLTLTFIYLAARYLAAEQAATPNITRWLLLLAPLVTTIRYEGLFLVLIVCGMIAWYQRQLIQALLLSIWAFIPIVVYGIWSVYQGWYFIPTSVLLKGLASKTSWKNYLHLMSLDIPQFCLILLMIAGCSTLAMTYFLTHTKKINEKRELTHLNEKIFFNAILIGITILHLYFVRMGWFYRHEAYLVYNGILILGLIIGDFIKKLSSTKIEVKWLPIYMMVGLSGIYAAYPFIRYSST